MRNFLFATAFAVAVTLSPARAEDGRPVLPPGAVGHVVVVGDDLPTVARLYGISVERLRQANPDAGWQEGELIVVPQPDRPWPTHVVRSGETLWRIGKGYGIPVDELRQANGMSDNTLLPGNVLSLPRAQKPDWTIPEPAPAVALAALPSPASSAEVYGSAAPRPPKALTGQWVEVRLPDNRRAWAPVGTLVVGSWQPQSPTIVVALGREFVGVPYKWGGVDPNGWDCSGFVQEVYRLGGHQVPRLADAQYDACHKVGQEALQPGDLVFFNTDGSGISHVGIYTGERSFLHASSSRGVVEDCLDDDYWVARYHGAGRIPAWSEVTSPTPALGAAGAGSAETIDVSQPPQD